MKRKIYRIWEEFPSVGDLFQTKVGSSKRILQFYRMDSNTVWLTDGKRLFERNPEQVQAVPVDKKLLQKMGFSADGNRYMLDCNHLHLEAYEHANVMHIEITPEGTTRKTYVCCDFLHEIQHLKRLEIDGIQFPLQFVTFHQKFN